MAVSSVKELRKNRKFSWTRIKNQLLGIVGNPFNVIAPYQKQFTIHRTLSCTRHGWISLPAIVQYSSLLPPVGVRSVSQYRCGGPSF